MLAHITEFSPDQIVAIEAMIEAATEHVRLLPIVWADPGEPFHDGTDPTLGEDCSGHPAYLGNKSDKALRAMAMKAVASSRAILAKRNIAVSEPPATTGKEITMEIVPDDQAVVNLGVKVVPGDEAAVSLYHSRVEARRKEHDDDFSPLDIRSEWSSPPPARRWLVQDWLPADRIAMLTGRGGAGKSQLALQLAYAIAGNMPEGDRRAWFRDGPEIPGGQGAVAFATWEDDGDEALRRMLNNPEFDHAGAPAFEESVDGRFHFIDLAGRGPLWTTGASHQSYGELTPVGAALRGSCQALGARLLIVDALSSAYAGNENERPAVRAFLSSWDRWARDAACVVLLIAHPPKGEGEDNHYSGSTDWRNGTRSLIVLERTKGVADRAKLVCDKLNSAKTPDTIPLGSPRFWERIEVDPTLIAIGDDEASDIRERIVDALTTHGELSKNKIRAAISKAKAATFNVVDAMELDGAITMRKEGPAHLYSLAPVPMEGTTP